MPYIPPNTDRLLAVTASSSAMLAPLGAPLCRSLLFNLLAHAKHTKPIHSGRARDLENEGGEGESTLVFGGCRTITGRNGYQTEREGEREGGVTEGGVKKGGGTREKGMQESMPSGNTQGIKTSHDHLITACQAACKTCRQG